MEAELLKPLLVSEEEILKKLVEKVKQLLGIDEKTGRTVIMADRTALRDADLVFIVVLGRHFANKLGLIPTDTITTDEVAEESGLKKTIAAARLNDLKSEGIVESVAPATWKIVFARTDEVINNITARLGRKLK